MLAVAMTYLIGRQIFPVAWPALLATLAVALDGVAITMSRIAMLDGVQAGLVASAVWCILVDRGAPDRRWRWAAGAVMGLALATKWSSGLALPGVIAVGLVSELRRNPGGSTAWLRWPQLSETARLLLPLVLLPIGIYVASYAGWFANADRSEGGRERCGESCSISETASAWLFEQQDMYALQGRLEISHPDRSRPAAWVTLTRPVLIYAEGCPKNPAPDEGCEVAPGKRAQILVLGNPALWWPALAAVPVLVWSLLDRRRRSASSVLLGFGGLLVLPWLLVPNPGFAFYLAPVVPFAALGLAQSVLVVIRHMRLTNWLPTLSAVALIACAVWLAPLWFAMPLDPAALDARRWLDSWR